jgi:hypothetical protein
MLILMKYNIQTMNFELPARRMNGEWFYGCRVTATTDSRTRGSNWASSAKKINGEFLHI